MSVWKAASGGFNPTGKQWSGPASLFGAVVWAVWKSEEPACVAGSTMQPFPGCASGKPRVPRSSLELSGILDSTGGSAWSRGTRETQTRWMGLCMGTHKRFNDLEKRSLGAGVNWEMHCADAVLVSASGGSYSILFFTELAISDVLVKTGSESKLPAL